MNRRALLGLVPVVLILGAFWLVVLAPTRDEVKATETQVLQATSRRDAAVAMASAAELARRGYPRDYASVVSLAEAVPADADVAALVRGLDAIAHANKLDFRTVTLSGTPTEKSAAPATGPVAATAGGAASAKSDAPAATGAAAGTGAPAAQGAGTVTQAPAGAAVGSARLLTMPFTFTAEGDYLSLQRFLKALHAMAGHVNGQVRVEGRLLTIDGFSFLAGRKGYPQLVALVSATAYLEPDPGSVIARSTRRRPALASTAAAAAATAAPALGAAR
jgi:hypothetical protein